MLFTAHTSFTGKARPVSYFSNLRPSLSLSLARDVIFVQQLSL